MEIGKLNRRIVFLENKTVTDEIGNHISEQTETYSCRAYVKINSSAESVERGVK